MSINHDPHEATEAARIRATIERWQQQLLQLDRRNRLLYFKVAGNVLSIVAEDIDRFLDLLSTSRKGLSFDYAEKRTAARQNRFELIDGESGTDEIYFEPGSIKVDNLEPLPLQRVLTYLRRRDREFTEEQGINVLFLAAGLLDWVDEDGVSATAPVVLIPCDLDKASPRDPFFLRPEGDDASLNATLRYKLSTLGVSLPDYEPDSPIEDYLQELDVLTAGKEGWSVRRRISLGLFQFSKMAMWEDLEKLKEDTDALRPLVLALAGGESVQSSRDTAARAWWDASPEALAGGSLDDDIDPREWPLVLPADFSQLQAVGATSSGRHLVIHGPPGTGKSQTITNLIGLSMWSGQSVLFVSEKKAALDVVKRRLDACGLGTFCLDLHSERARKASVYSQFQEALDYSASSGGNNYDYEALLRERDRLNSVVRALHERRAPLGRSAYQVGGLFSTLRELPSIHFPVESIEALDDALLATYTEKAQQVALFGAEFLAHANSRWIPLRAGRMTVGLASEIARHTANAAQKTEQAIELSEEFAQFLGIHPNTAEKLGAIGILLDLLQVAPGIERSWLQTEVRDRLLADAQDQAQSAARYRADADEAERLFGSPLPDVPFSHYLQRFESAAAADMESRFTSKSDWWATSPLELRKALEAAQSLPVASHALSQAIREAALFIGYELPVTLEGARSLCGPLGKVEDLAPVPSAWVIRSSAGLDSLYEELEGLAALARETKEAEQRLLTDWSDELLTVATSEMLVRLRTTHRSKLRRTFRSSYRTDRDAIIRCMRQTAAAPTIEAMTKVVEDALRTAGLKREWEARGNKARELLGVRFVGLDTAWTHVTEQIESTQGLIRESESESTLCGTMTDMNSGSVARRHRLRLEDAIGTYQSLIDALPKLAELAPDQASELASARLDDLRKMVEVVDSTKPMVRQEIDSLGVLRSGVSAASRCQAYEKLVANEEQARLSDYGRHYEGLATDWISLHAALEWTSAFVDFVGPYASSSTLEHAVEPMESSEYQSARRRLDDVLGALSETFGPLNDLFLPARTPWATWEVATLPDFVPWLDDLRRNADSALTWLQYQDAVQQLEATTEPNLVARIRQSTDRVVDVPGIVRRRIFEAWLEMVYDQSPNLRQFTAAGQEQLIANFRDLDARLVEASRQSIQRRCHSRFPSTYQVQASGGELATLRGQLSRKRGQMPVRKLLRRIPSVAVKLKPCFMMSPLAVSQYLEKSDVQNETVGFDLVIFDEASQIFPEDAVPAISRSSQVVVVGDSNQLPPTNFFRKTTDDGLTDEEGEDDDAMAGRESILDALVGRAGSDVHERYLTLHYRSRHEDLIRFSNHQYYRDRLQVFPSPELETQWLGVRNIFVPEGRYDSGATRTNVGEAERVVELVFELFRSVPTDESIGVVALSRAQADCILALLDARRRQNPDTEGRFTEAGAEPFFVKNLENVQGDERDHIVLCIGYGPTTATGKPVNRFGPLSSELGWRRMNVAVSRARRSTTVVHSIDPTDITATSRGAVELRRFLEFAADPRTAIQARQVLDPDSETESPFEDAVKAALESRGYRVQPQVGVAGFRIDFGVYSEDGRRFELGIECDGATYHSAPSARDRDCLRQAVLEGLGWRIHRVWSTAWIRDPEGELRAIEASIMRARAGHWPELPTVAKLPSQSAPSEIDVPSDEPETTEELRSPSPYLFALYSSAHIQTASSWQELKSATHATLRIRIEEVVRVEGPVHREIVMIRLRDAFGQSRAGPSSQDNVMSAIDKLVRDGVISEPEPGFLVGDGSVQARRPSAAVSRSIRHISRVEVEQGIMLVAAELGKSDIEALMREVRSQFGFERTGDDIRAAMDAALNRLLAAGRLAMDQDKDVWVV